MKTEQKAIFATRIGKLRNDKGMSQEELAAALNIDRGTIAKYETQKRIPSYEHLTAFTEYFNVSTDYLLGIAKNKTPDPDISMICDYTGLSDDAIQTLNVIKGSNVSDTVSALIAELGQCINECINLGSSNKSSVLQKLSSFLEMNTADSTQRFYISKSGKITESTSTDREYTSQLSMNDTTVLREISTDEIITRIMLNDIEQSIIDLKSNERFWNNDFNSNSDFEYDAGKCTGDKELPFDI